MLLKKIIFLECDLGGRDARIYLTLAKFLEEKIPNIKVYLISRINIKFFICNFRNSIFILTPQKIDRFKSHKSNIFYILETEGLLNRELYHLTYQKKNLQKVRKIFVWNKLTKKNLILDYNLVSEKISVLGPFRLAYMSIIKKKRDKFTVGFMCRNVGLSNFKNISKIKFIFDYINLEKINKKLNLQEHWSYHQILKNNVISIENLIKVLNFYKTKNINFNVRPHPNENFKDYLFLEKKFKNVKIDKSHNIYDWIEKVNIVFTPSSSTNIDLILGGIPIIDLKGNYQKETFLKLHKSISFKTNYDEKSLSKINIRKIKNPKETAIFLKYKKKYLNNCNIDFTDMIKFLNEDTKKIKEQLTLKLLVYDFYNNLRYVLACLYKGEKIDFKYNFSYFFRRYSFNHKLLKTYHKVKFNFF